MSGYFQCVRLHWKEIIRVKSCSQCSWSRRCGTRNPLAQYERGALLQPWAREAGRDYDSVRDTLIHVMELRLPLSATVAAVLRAGDLALVLGERHMAGTGPGCQPIRLSGLGSTVVRRQPDGAWCIVAEAWCLDEPADGGAGTALLAGNPALPGARG